MTRSGSGIAASSTSAVVSMTASGPPRPGPGTGIGTRTGTGLRLAVRSESFGEELGEGDAADRMIRGQMIAAMESGEGGARDADRQNRATAPAGREVHAGELVGASDLGAAHVRNPPCGAARRRAPRAAPRPPRRRSAGRPRAPGTGLMGTRARAWQPRRMRA